jgi:UDP-glucose 4-epimerase
MKKKKLLILGADGFLGSNLAKSLRKDNKYKIILFDLFKNGEARNLSDFDQNFEMMPGNFLNREDLKKALQGADYVFHYISLTTPGSSMSDPLIDVETNICGTIVLLEECVKVKVKRIIFSSSGGAIYGNQEKKKLNEDDPQNPISPYAISKLAIEKYLEYFRLNNGLEYLILRYSNPYGPGQNIFGGQGIIPIFLNLVKQGKPITIFGDGKNIRDYIYIDDLINITKMIFSQKTKYNIYNIGSGKGEIINEIVSSIEKVVKKKVVVKKKPPRTIDVRRIILDTKRISEEIGYAPKISLDVGILKTWQWVKKVAGNNQ